MKINRPKIHVPLTTTDHILELLGFTVLVILWIKTWMQFKTLPDTIATHYNFAGEPDAYGEKSSIWMLPFIATGIYFIITILNFFPRILSYPVNITIENAPRQYRNATTMNRIIKLNLAVTFLLLVIQINRVHEGQSEGLGIWFTPLILLIIIIPSGWFIYKAFKHA